MPPENTQGAPVMSEMDVHTLRASHRAELAKWIFAAGITTSVAFFGWLGNRAVGVLDRTEVSVATLQQSVAVINKYTETISAELLDHETRLRQDREVLVAHGSNLQTAATRILTLEQFMRAVPNSPGR